MEKLLEKLSHLNQAEESCKDKARELRKQQLDLCKKAIIGKCFKERQSHIKHIEGEEYGEYTCFIGTFTENKWEYEFALKAIVIRFDEIKEVEGWGAVVSEQSDTVSQWIDILEEAEEITAEEFNHAMDRVIEYFGKKIRKTTGEE